MNLESTSTLRLVYMGTADFAVPALRALASGNHDIVAVYTQPARPAGRGLQPRRSPVQKLADELDFSVHTPVSLKEKSEQQALLELKPDLVVVAAYGLLLPQAILDIPRLGCINIHGSCLPRWRGAAPIQRALLAGDKETGITIIRMEAGLDTGPMLAMERVSIDETTTASRLHDQLAKLGANMITPMVDRLAEGPLSGTPQTEELATYARKIEKAEGQIDWRQPAQVIDQKLRALNPWPGCWTLADGERIRLLRGMIDPEGTESGQPAGTVLEDGFLPDGSSNPGLRVVTGDGVLCLLELQKAGGRPMEARAFLRGHPFPPGFQLG